MFKTFAISLLLSVVGYLFALAVPAASSIAPTAFLIIMFIFLLGSVCRAETEQADDTYESHKVAKQIDRIKVVKDALFFLLCFSAIVGTMAATHLGWGLGGAVFMAIMCAVMKHNLIVATREQDRLEQRWQRRLSSRLPAA